MRKLIYSIGMVLFLCFGCKAQQPLREGRFSVSGRILVVTEQNNPYTNTNLYGIRYEKEQKRLPESKPNAFPVRERDIHLEVDKIRDIIYKVLGDKRQVIAQNNGTMVLHVSLEQSGAIEEIFYTMTNVSISLEDVDKIDQRIKKEVKATFTGKDYLDHYLINYPSIRITF